MNTYEIPSLKLTRIVGVDNRKVLNLKHKYLTCFTPILSIMTRASTTIRKLLIITITSTIITSILTYAIY